MAAVTETKKNREIGSASISLLLDYLIWPSLVIIPTLASSVLHESGMHSMVLTPLLIGSLAIFVRFLEWIRPERIEHLPLDQSMWIEAGHCFFSVTGYGLAVSGTVWVADHMRDSGILPAWPSHWPFLLQFILAMVLHELLSYWQHRSFHQVPLFWKFHSLHHHGARLNCMRTSRFHFVDALISTSFSYFPLSLMATPENVLVVLGVFLGATGLMQHANVRMRTPIWMDLITCTPVLHRRHHSRLMAESHCNYGNSVTLFDVVFGTFVSTQPEGPDEIGIENDPVSPGMVNQVVEPFAVRKRG